MGPIPGLGGLVLGLLIALVISLILGFTALAFWIFEIQPALWMAYVGGGIVAGGLMILGFSCVVNYLTEG